MLVYCSISNRIVAIKKESCENSFPNVDTTFYTKTITADFVI